MGIILCKANADYKGPRSVCCIYNTAIYIYIIDAIYISQNIIYVNVPIAHSWIAQLGREATSHSCWGRKSSLRLHTRTYDMTTCGLSREELAQNRWIGADQRCLAIRTDGIVCDCLYTAHHSAQAPTSGKFHPISFFYSQSHRNKFNASLTDVWNHFILYSHSLTNLLTSAG
jgi:hypothetical protein